MASVAVSRSRRRLLRPRQRLERVARHRDGTGARSASKQVDQEVVEHGDPGLRRARSEVGHVDRLLPTDRQVPRPSRRVDLSRDVGPVDPIQPGGLVQVAERGKVGEAHKEVPVGADSRSAGHTAGSAEPRDRDGARRTWEDRRRRTRARPPRRVAPRTAPGGGSGETPDDARPRPCETRPCRRRRIRDARPGIRRSAPDDEADTRRRHPDRR